jgi:hypothetical protein
MKRSRVEQAAATNHTLATLRRALAEARRELAPPAQPVGQSLTAIELERALETAETYRAVSARWPLEWHNLPTRFWSGLNRLLRRYLRWYVEPIVEQQNAFNAALTECLLQLRRAQVELEGQRAALRAAGKRQEQGGAGKGTARDFEGLMALVRARAALEPQAAFPELELEPLLARLEGLREVQAHWELRGTTLYERGLVAVHKLVRRYLRWLVNPLVEQQNAHNAALVQALRALAARDAALRAELAARRASEARGRSA